MITLAVVAALSACSLDSKVTLPGEEDGGMDSTTGGGDTGALMCGAGPACEEGQRWTISSKHRSVSDRIDATCQVAPNRQAVTRESRSQLLGSLSSVPHSGQTACWCTRRTTFRSWSWFRRPPPDQTGTA